MQIRELSIPDAFEITPAQHGDDRGVFFEWYRFDRLEEAVGHPLSLRQANASVSKRGVVRGIHFADVPIGQAKYVTAMRGAVLDFVVDIRVGSPTFGQWDSVLLDDTDRRAIYLAEGLGHAFIALSDDATVSYLVSDVYRPASEHGINPLDFGCHPAGERVRRQHGAKPMRTNMRLALMLLACVGLGVLTWLDNNPPAPDLAGANRVEATATDTDAVPEDTSEAAMLSDDAGESFDDDVQGVTDASQYIIDPETSPSNPLSALDITTLRDTVSRPLFASSRRRPPESDAAAAEVAAADPPTFELLGVALGGPRAIAVLRRKSDGRSYRVEAGDVLAGWQVTAVKPHEVLLERAEGVSMNVPLLRP